MTRPDPPSAPSLPIADAVTHAAPRDDDGGTLIVATAALDALFAAFEADSAFADRLGFDLAPLSGFGTFA